VEEISVPSKSATNEQSSMDSNDLTFRWIDTPDLDLSRSPDKTAKAICNALSDVQDSGFKLIFVVGEEAGKARVKDQMLINEVMGSFVLKNTIVCKSYGIIINKCTSLKSKAFNDQDKFILKAALGSESQTNKFPTQFVKFVPNLDGKDEGKFDFEALKKWIICDVPYLNGTAAIAEIDFRNFQEQVAAVKRNTESLLDIKLRDKRTKPVDFRAVKSLFYCYNYDDIFTNRYAHRLTVRVEHEKDRKPDEQYQRKLEDIAQVKPKRRRVR